MTHCPGIGVVVIGRNEGDRLKICLQSIVRCAQRVVYVDSGSTDGSVVFSKELGVDVVELDLSTPFTAARARNTGFARLSESAEGLDAVFFIDGDCELLPEFLSSAFEILRSRPEITIVAGRLLERFRDASIYNRLCHLEWTTNTGEVDAVGGIFIIRANMFAAVGGFNEALIAGEEPELCYRIRRQGGKVLRIRDEMAVHDAAMFRFGQWWRRSVRGGHAFAEGYSLHGEYWKREVRSNWMWGGVFPASALILAWPTSGISLLMFCVYPLWMLRIARGRRWNFGESWSDALLYGCFCMIAKFPGNLGQLLFYWRLWRKRRPELIEYK